MPMPMPMPLPAAAKENNTMTTMGRPKNQQLLVDDDDDDHSSLCRKHRWQRRPGVCAHCLSERLQRLFCADCGLQKALPSSYSSSSSSSSSSFSCRCTSSSSSSSSSSFADTDTDAETEANMKSLLERNASIKFAHIHGGVIAAAAAAARPDPALLQKAVPTPRAVAETEPSLTTDSAVAWSRHRSCSAAVASTRTSTGTGTGTSMSMKLSALFLVPQAEPQNPSNSKSPSSSSSASSWSWGLGFLWKEKKKRKKNKNKEKEEKINDNGNFEGSQGVGTDNKGTYKLDLEVAAQRLAKSRSLAMRRRSLSAGLQDFQGMGMGFGLPPQRFCPTPAPSAMDDHRKAADSYSSSSSGWSLSGTAKALRKSSLWR